MAALCCAALALAPARASAQPDAGVPAPAAVDTRPIVAHVVVHYPPDISPEQLAENSLLLKVHAGDHLSRDAVRDSIVALFASGKFSDIVVRESQGPDGLTLIFDLTALLHITQMQFLGNTALSRGELIRAALTALVPNHGARVTTGLPAEFFPEELEAIRLALEKTYERRGYASARVSGHLEQLDPSNVALQFTVEEGAPTRIGALTVAGDPGLTPDELLEATGLKLGDVLDRERVDAAVTKLRDHYQKRGFYRAQVSQARVERSSDGEVATVALPVEAGPEIRFHFHGSRSFPEADLETRLGYTGEETLDEDEENLLAKRVERFYQLSGFFDATVTPEETWSPDRRRLVVVFDVNEGLPLAVTHIRFVGNHHFDEKFLRARIEESLRAAVPGPPESGGLTLPEASSALPPSDHPEHQGQYSVDPSTVFAEEPYKDALARITDLYHADGYLETVPDLPALDIDDRTRTATVTITIAEGPQTRLRKQQLIGVPDGEALLASHTKMKVGEPLNSLTEDESRLALVRELQRRGNYFAKVKAEENWVEGTEHTQADVVFTADPGPQVRVRRVIIAGEPRTREGIIESALLVRPGEVLDPDKLAESQRNLQALGIFTRVTVEPLQPTHVDAEKDVVVSVDERPTYEVTAGPGFSLVDGPRAAGEFVWSNVGGLGVDFVVQGKLNYFNWSYPVLFASSGPDQLQPQPGLAGFGGHVNVGLRDPRLYFAQPYQVAAHADVVAERVNRPAYRFSRFAVLGGLDWRIAGPLTFGFTVSPFEVDDIRKQQGLETIITRLSQTDLQQLRFEDGITRLASVTPALTLDLRDNASSPHSGFLLAATTEVAHDLGGNFSTFYAKPSVTANVYVPLGSRVTLALSARGGRVYPLESNSYTVPPKRFFLGGASTLRGYPEDGLTPDDRRTVLDKEVQNCQALSNPVGCSEAAKVAEQGALLPSEGGQAFVLYKGELRFPVVGDLEGGLFVDAGNLWLDTRFANLRPGDLVYTPGVGVRYGTPVGPIALDVGINPNPDTLLNETVLSLRYVQFSIGLF